jgi:hypothetical protein
VDFDGTVTTVTGVCPIVIFTVGGMTVVTDSSTDYKKSDCGDLRRGSEVSGAGLTQPTGTIRATEVQVKKGKDNEGDDDQ